MTAAKRPHNLERSERFLAGACAGDCALGRSPLAALSGGPDIRETREGAS